MEAHIYVFPHPNHMTYIQKNSRQFPYQQCRDDFSYAAPDGNSYAQEDQSQYGLQDGSQNQPSMDDNSPLQYDPFQFDPNDTGPIMQPPPGYANEPPATVQTMNPSQVTETDKTTSTHVGILKAAGDLSCDVLKTVASCLQCLWVFSSDFLIEPCRFATDKCIAVINKE